MIPHRETPVARALHGDPVRDDFRNFLYLMWTWLRLPAPTEVQYDIAAYLASGPARLMVEAFRGVGKSWITAAFVLWCLYRDPNERVLVVSASKDRADAFSTFAKRCIAEWDLLAELRPEPGMRDSNVAFDVGGSMPHQSPSVRSIGITGQMTGGRASIIVPDDIETPKNSQTQVMRDRLAELVKEFDAILMTDEDLKSIGLNRARIVYLGTPQTEMSLYNQLPNRGYALRVWPARYPQKPQDFKGTLEQYIGAKYKDHLAPMLYDRLMANPALQWQPTDSKRFTEIDLLAREASYARSGFALQFQLDTALSDADRYPLKLSDLMVMGLSPTMGPVQVAWGSAPENVARELEAVGLAGDRWHFPMFISKDFAEYEGCIMAIDPSGRGSDETGYAVVAMLKGFLFILECSGLKGGYDDDTLETLAKIAQRNGVKKIVIESNFGDGMFTKLLTPFLTRIYPCTTEEIKSSVQKEKRIIDTLEPVFNQHRVIVNRKVVEDDFKTDDPKYQLFHQMTRITREKGALVQDDRIDVLEMAVKPWVEVLGNDVKKNQDEHRQQMMDLELEDFMAHVLGFGGATSLNWMSDLRD